MKRVICYAAVFLFAVGTANAQKHKKPVSKKSAKEQTTAKQKFSSATKKNHVFLLTSSTAHAAYAAPKNYSELQIADPTVKALDLRAEGANIRISGSGIVGMPRGSYGFANGRIKLYNTVATTPGGITGSGTVATGSYPGGVGAAANSISVNGKSPYAGSGMWGSNNSGVMLLPPDTAQRSVAVPRSQ